MAIANLIFYRTGEIIRDLGLIYFSSILEEMNINSNMKVCLENNYLEVKDFNKDEFLNYLLKEKIFRVFVDGIKEELKKKKYDIEFLEGIKNDNFLSKINEIDILSEKMKESIEKKFNSKYFPYIRNSAKYGYNSKGEINFHKNIKKLIYIVQELNSKDDEEQKNILKEYEALEKKCIVCHTYLTTKYDITHKDEKKLRKSSKYNYLFMGSEKNTFTNYAAENPSVCFICEFFNLMFLLYLSIERPTILAYTDDLGSMKFINYKLMLKSREFNEKGFYKKLSKFKNTRVRIYDISTDVNKGVLINLNSILEFRAILKMIKLSDVIDKYNFSKDTYVKIALGKKIIKNNNYAALKSFLLNELIVINDKDGKRSLDTWKTVNNIKNYLEIICELRKEDLEVEDKNFEKLGIILGAKIKKSENKRAIAFKVIEMLKSDNRQGLFQNILHLITVNQTSIPDNFADVIIYGDEDELHYCIGKFLEKFLSSNKEEDE
ncbi:hypothetical protein CLTEP_19810 [Clostridium tepidiprofundi DSM 19306]|uniref:CRISPR-associated protein n=1 Tax=Clostridium tepidiprofundi DSM 19306 TaxID=1121338 RepID=A0A151B2D8_9CLOT|nr:hypothetical protein [Clostridium tepidiprofundi]KYH34081.1 hypothetical protein CLTEP_19810 [Clostridium tepidiprofundi DSM 19306]